MRLQIGGTEAIEGWENLNAQPGPHVDYVGNCIDLGIFADESVDEIYASHVIEHLGYIEILPRALAEIHRVLKKGGHAKISVPDLEILSQLFLAAPKGSRERIMVMRIMFGGQQDEYDFHYVGFDFDMLSEVIRNAGFSKIERISDFGLCEDTSSFRFCGVPISLNVIAYK